MAAFIFLMPDFLLNGHFDNLESLIPWHINTFLLSYDALLLKIKTTECNSIWLYCKRQKKKIKYSLCTSGLCPYNNDCINVYFSNKITKTLHICMYIELFHVSLA